MHYIVTTHKAFFVDFEAEILWTHLCCSSIIVVSLSLEVLMPVLRPLFGGIIVGIRLGKCQSCPGLKARWSQKSRSRYIHTNYSNHAARSLFSCIKVPLQFFCAQSICVKNGKYASGKISCLAVPFIWLLAEAATWLRKLIKNQQHSYFKYIRE